MRKRFISFFLIIVLLFGTSLNVFAASFATSRLTLTKREKEYFSQRKSLRVLTAPSTQPYSYNNTGTSLDILKYLCKSAGISLETIETASYADALIRLENGEAELAAVKFSQLKNDPTCLPYLDAPLQMVHHNQVSLLDPSSLSLAKLQGLDLTFDSKNNLADPIAFDSISDCLSAVRSQQSDIFLCDIYQLSVISGCFPAWDLMVTTIPYSEVSVGFGLSANTDTRLISALQSAVDTLSPSELSSSLMHHSQYSQTGFRLTQFVYQNPFELLCVVTSLFFVILLCMFVFFRIRSSQHEELRGYEESYRMLAETFGEAGLEYDFLSDRFTFFGGRRDRIDLPEIMEQAHTALLQGTFRFSLKPEELDQMLQNNKPNQSYQAELQCGMKEGNWNWFRLIYIVVCTSESHRRPIRLIGCLVNIEDEYRERERLLQIGYRDQLSGLLNRTAGESEITQALEDKVEPKVLLFLDIDYFKNFNDHYGHSCGDEVICALGAALGEVFSPSDILCRWGGDEFILLIKGDGAQEHTLYDSLRKLQEMMKKVTYFEHSLSVTLSIGGAAAAPDLSFQSLFEIADATLYTVKNKGRNHFRVVYEPCDSHTTSTEVSE